MKVNILFPISENPIGGGNQFLRSLRDAFIEMGVYSGYKEADVILFNSYQNIYELLRVKQRYSKKLFVHRVDGPIRLYNKMDDMRDGITNEVNRYIADATVFQSNYSLKSNRELGLKKTTYETVIYNGVDTSVFTFGNHYKPADRKIKIIASSWSPNMKKGFDVYKYLDSNLDFNKYEMTFVGNSPIKFDNIRVIKPVGSNQLAQFLKKSDIYITASQNDPCSNSLLEAIACGLPVLCRNDGGHPELLRKSGEAGCLFDYQEEIPSLLSKIEDNYRNYTSAIIVSDIKDVAVKYIDFFNGVLRECDSTRKELSLYGAFYIGKTVFSWKHKLEK